MKRFVYCLALEMLASFSLHASVVAPSETLAVRFALVVGDRGNTEAPAFGQVLSDRLMADYLKQWDPTSDNPEIRRIFALRGLTEVTRQVARFPATGGKSSGAVRIGDVDWRVELDVQSRAREAMTAVRIFRGAQLIAAPMIRTSLGEKAIVSTSSDSDGLMLFLIVQADAQTPGVALPATPGGVAPTPPRVIGRVAPVYPPSEKSNRVEGMVVVGLRIGATGELLDAQVEQGLSPAFDQAALDAIRRWTFEPGRVGGLPAEMKMSISIRFAL